MKGFRFEPIRWAGWLLALLLAVSGAAAQVPGVLPDEWLPYVNYLTAVVLALGVVPVVRSMVTPVAAPRDDMGARLVPAGSPGGPAPRQRDGYDRI